MNPRVTQPYHTPQASPSPCRSLCPSATPRARDGGDARPRQSRSITHVSSEVTDYFKAIIIIIIIIIITVDVVVDATANAGRWRNTDDEDEGTEKSAQRSDDDDDDDDAASARRHGDADGGRPRTEKVAS